MIVYKYISACFHYRVIHLQKPAVLVLLLLLIIPAHSQILRTKNWHFGYNTSLRFEKDTVIVGTSAISSVESCASISDESGNLLLYTDGVTVWNKHNKVIPNGTGILGHKSSARGSVFVTMPGNDSLLWLFTADFQGNSNGLRYTVIRNYGNDSFEILEKNRLVRTSVAEPIGVVNHRDNRSVWVVCREYNGYRYFAYLLTANGLLDCPVVSASSLYIGPPNPLSAQNNIVIRQDGSLLVQYYFTQHVVELFRFDNSSGQLHSPIVLKNIAYPIGACFSPNGRILYINERTRDMIQYKIDVYDKSYLLNNSYHISGLYYQFELQQTPQRKIYSMRPDSLGMDVINNPDSFGIGCDLQVGGQYLGKNRQGSALPNFNHSYFYTPSADFGYTRDCYTNTLNFEGTDTFRAKDLFWLFEKGDTTDSRSGKSVEYTFSDTGTWQVNYIASASAQSDTVSKSVVIYPAWQKDILGADTFYCTGPAQSKPRFVLKAPEGMHCYHWQDGTMADTFVADTAGVYYVKVTNRSFCQTSDTIIIKEYPSPPKPHLTRLGDSLISSFNAVAHRWYRNGNLLQGKSNRSIPLDSNGLYWMEAENAQGCTTVSDSVLVEDLGLVRSLNQSSIRVYPNPVTDRLTIESPYDGYLRRIRYYDITGRVLLDISAPNTVVSISTAGWPEGIYVVKLLTENGVIRPVTVCKQ
ncbi:MAG: T9SS type A sorting domain-containing protein [Flavobacteriales bacterium]|nr:T9SS type A sorting domain-containing protein [Flavobacteriales bacterium]